MNGQWTIIFIHKIMIKAALPVKPFGPRGPIGPGSPRIPGGPGYPLFPKSQIGGPQIIIFILKVIP